MAEFLSLVSKLKNKFIYFIEREIATYQYHDLSEWDIQQLKEKGMRVKCQHSRFSLLSYQNACKESHQSKVWDYLVIPNHEIYKGNLSSRGGKTVIEVRDGMGNCYVGQALCSLSDSFCRKTGRKIALSRMIKV